MSRRFGKKNCWEAMLCEREPGGKLAEQFGPCPASTEGKAEGINEGVNAGRCCWAVEGTYCDGSTPMSFVEKGNRCLQCEFYKRVKKEQGRQFAYIGEILKVIRGE